VPLLLKLHRSIVIAFYFLQLLLPAVLISCSCKHQVSTHMLFCDFELCSLLTVI
jgi:hypothetical protein